MQKTNLQVPISVKLKKKASKIAEANGFSSLQELVRVFIANYSNGDVNLGFTSSNIDTNILARFDREYEEAQKGLSTGETKVLNSKEDINEYFGTLI